MFRTVFFVFTTLCIALSANQAMADDREHRHGHSNNDCPVKSPYPGSYGDMFGEDVAEALNCNDRRHRVKIVVQVNKFCRDSHDSKGNPITTLQKCYDNDMEKDGVLNRDYAVINMIKMVEDLEVTHGMKPSDYDMVAVVHGGGAELLTRGNYYEGHVKKLMKSGVKFYLCLNTAASWIKSGKLTRGAISEDLIEGIGYVPAGLSAISDFQHQGYKYVQP